MPTRTPWLLALAAAALLPAPALPAPLPVPSAAPSPSAASPALQAAKAPAEQPPPAPPQAIPVHHVFRAADELDAPLARAAAVASPDPAVDALEPRLAASALVISRLQLELGPHLQDASARELQRLGQLVAREDGLLAGAQDVLEQRSDLLSDTLRDVQDRLASWVLTAEAAQRERAPAPVARRTAQAVERLRAEETRLLARRELLVGLQGRAADLQAELARIAAAVAAAEAALERQLFEVESAPLWRAVGRAEGVGGLGAPLRQALREGARDVGGFVADTRLALGLHLAVVLGLGLALIALRRPAAVLEAGGAPLRGAGRVLARPWSASVLLSLALVSATYPPLPPIVRDLLVLGLLAPLLRVLPALVPEVFRRPLLTLAALVALDRLSALAPPRTLLARLAGLAVSAGAVVALGRGLRRDGWVRHVGPGAWGVATRALAAAALALLAVAVGSNLVGNATLAERLSRATLDGALLAAVLVGVEAIVEGALAALLHLPALQRRPLVARHRPLLERRTGAALRLAALALWAWRTATELGVAGAGLAAASAVLGLRLTVGGLDVSLGNVAAFGVTLALAVGIARAVRFVLDEGVFAEVQLPRGVPAAISATVQYALVLLGFSWAVLASGMEMSRFSFLVGALGVGIGFGLQNVVNNLVCGLILLYERPVKAGDIVEVGAVTGEVTRIGVRSSTVRTFAGAEVIVPNATLVSTEVTNWTLSDRRRRVELAVGVAYGTPPRQVIDLLLAAVRGRPGVLGSPEPLAILLRFGESAIEFVLRFWTADPDRWQVLASDVLIEVHASLGRAGIQIPFPQRDLHVRSLDAAAAQALAVSGEAGGDRSP